MEKLVVRTEVAANREKVWNLYTQPEHIMAWNFAHPSWHCPSASNDLRIGGRYLARMEAKDGSFGFDFDAIYTEVVPTERFMYEFGGRQATVEFQTQGNLTEVVVSFDPETENPLEMQQQGWQAILDNFKRYAESNLEA
jgi:uncharacterized protein YndB with AHSA1/START domain